MTEPEHRLANMKQARAGSRRGPVCQYRYPPSPDAWWLRPAPCLGVFFCYSEYSCGWTGPTRGRASSI